MCGMMARCKFYFAWAISEASLIASGFCFHGFDESGVLAAKLCMACSDTHAASSSLPVSHQRGLAHCAVLSRL